MRDFLRGIVANQWIDSEDYKQSQKAGAFLQCDYPDYILIGWVGNAHENGLGEKTTLLPDEQYAAGY